MQLKPETQKQIEWTLTRYPNKQAALLPVLYLLQYDQGSITDDGVLEAAKVCDVSPAWVYGVLSFYTLFKRPWEGQHTIWVCSTLSCALAGSDRLHAWAKEALNIGPDGVSADGKYCLKKQECLAACDRAPAVQIDEDYYLNMTPAKLYDLLKLQGPRPPNEPDAMPPARAEGPCLLKYVHDRGSETIDHYLRRGGYESARKAVTAMKPDEVTQLVVTSGLRGRGGAGFPTGQKWTFVPKQSPKPKYLVCNADESEPGTFKDRMILERDPHGLIEGIIIAAYAVGSNAAYIYIRGEFGQGYRVLKKALEDAYAKGFVGKGVFGSPFALDITIHRGAGAYICGEETALLSSLEGKRGYPKIKPPFPAVEGLFGCPTIINNVETLAFLPHILREGPAWFKTFGNEKSPGLKIIGVGGHVMRPGLYEVGLGTPLRKMIYDYAGGIRNGKKLKAVIPGGSSAGVLTPDEIDLPMDFESLAAKGQILGTAGVTVMDEDTCMVNALWNILRFYHHESCGQCTPCREGTGWLEKMVARIEQGGGKPSDLDLMVETGNNMCGRTICVLADAAAYPTKHFIGRFRAEFEEHMKLGRCPFRKAQEIAPVGARF